MANPHTRNQPQHLYGAHEIGQRLGVSRTRVGQLTTRPDFPQPYDRLCMGTVWQIADVEDWITEHRPDVPPRSDLEGTLDDAPAGV